MDEIRDALLAAHVEHELSRLQGDALTALVDERVAAFFEWLEHVKLDDVLTRELIVGVIERYVIELKVSGGITELAGEMANVVFSSSASLSTRMAEICEPASYEEFADKIVALDGVHRELVRYVTQSSAFGTLASRVVSRVLMDLVFRGDDEHTGSGLKEVFQAVGRKVLPGLEGRLEAILSAYIEKHAVRFTRKGERHLLKAVDPEWVRQIADEIWDSVSKKPLSEAAAAFTAQDLEDFVVLGYEFWLKFRKTRYFHAVAAEVVDQLFAKYGNESLSSLIADMGVTEEMVSRELGTLLAPLLTQALRTGFLERELRAYLAPFYGSPAVAVILAGRRGAKDE